LVRPSAGIRGIIILLPGRDVAAVADAAGHIARPARIGTRVVAANPIDAETAQALRRAPARCAEGFLANARAIALVRARADVHRRVVLLPGSNIATRTDSSGQITCLARSVARFVATNAIRAEAAQT
jgi:hypothetical protein